MARTEETLGPPTQADRDALAREWRRLGRAATCVAALTSPAAFVVLYVVNDLPLWLSILLTLFLVVAFRGAVDIICHRLIPRPSMYEASPELAAEDVIFRRRRWYWRTKFRHLLLYALIFLAIAGFALFFVEQFLGVDAGLFNSLTKFRDSLDSNTRISLALNQLQMLWSLPLLFLINFLIFFGPLLMFGVMQMKAFEPGESDWGVKLDDVRGQKEPKEEVKRVIQLWSAGDEFKKAGGKPERGLLLIGAPGTGKTMLSKAVATSFNSPIMTMPGSGFAQTFIGLDVVMVMILLARARRLARKWGGTCMIFIDEIDAVGRRRSGLGGMFGHAGVAGASQAELEAHLFHGPWGALTSSGDLVLETRAWRERIFAQRREPALPTSGAGAVGQRIQNFMFPGMGGGMALNQLLVQMDGMDSPPMFKRWATKKFNTFLDATYFVPQRVFGRRLRLKPAKPRSEQVYFIGATNVNIEELDPALIRPGRMGRHIWFRTPTVEDRKDIFDLYINRVAHVDDLDSPRRRDELARITGGYSPAMIEQVCSMALTYAHADRRAAFDWRDIIEAMTTIESGTAISVNYVEEETRAVAIHEAGHAVASHVYMNDVLSTRLSIRMRGGSLGHHQAIEKEERFSAWRHEDVGKLVWTLGAMAAEHVFYGENSRGVGGDVGSATTLAALMVGMWGMGPEPIDLSHLEFEDDEAREKREQALADRFERIGSRIMNRASGGGLMQGDPLGAVLGDREKRRAAAQILGQSYLTALCLIRHNREQVAEIAEMLVERKEMHGDEVVAMLDAAQLEAPAIDLTDDTIWPKL
ncbi:MAG TPA: AAA family ATPase [Baekduia sp.]|nr:AAA family ATPase [Baekduia sp.]